MANNPGEQVSKAPLKVGLFVTCLVDLFRPNIGFAAVKLLLDAGCEVEVPAAQTCCGQPAYNSGDNADTRALAEQVISTFEDYDYVVAPSGSCAGMLKLHYPTLFTGSAVWKGRADVFAGKVYELFSFLTDICDQQPITAQYPGTVTYHDSCSGLREMGVKSQPRQLLSQVRDLTLEEMPDAETCCGFGGTFCVKFPRISERMVTDKTLNVSTSGAQTLLGGDLGCLLNMAGHLKRNGSKVRVYHAAEVLADMTTDVPGLGDSKD